MNDFVVRDLPQPVFAYQYRSDVTQPWNNDPHTYETADDAVASAVHYRIPGTLIRILRVVSEPSYTYIIKPKRAEFV